MGGARATRSCCACCTAESDSHARRGPQSDPCFMPLGESLATESQATESQATESQATESLATQAWSRASWPSAASGSRAPACFNGRRPSEQSGRRHAEARHGRADPPGEVNQEPKGLAGPSYSLARALLQGLDATRRDPLPDHAECPGADRSHECEREASLVARLETCPNRADQEGKAANPERGLRDGAISRCLRLSLLSLLTPLPAGAISLEASRRLPSRPLR
jgi:hypothetical protein